MELPVTYYRDEVIDGFYVPSIVKRGWAAQLEVLKVVIDICEKYDIQYFAEWGTMLGAVRHKGYIPWDDDVDISMKRDDYEKFLSVAQKELKGEYRLFNTYTDSDVEQMLTRVVNTRLMSFAPEFLDRYHGFPYIAGIDIFPLDYLPRDEELLKETDDLSKIVFCLGKEVDNKVLSDEEFEQALTELEGVCNIKLDRTKNLKRQLFRLGEGLYGAFTEEESDYLVNMTLWQENPGFKIPKEYYGDTVKMKFENMQINVPVAYDAILKLRYGDYMKLVKGGGGHDYPFFDRQEKLIEREQGVVIFNYKFNKEDLNRKETKPVKKLVEIIENVADMLTRLNGQIIDALCNEQYDGVAKMLEETQNLALQAGKKIEDSKGEGTKTVQCLEKYCEDVYRLFSILTGENIEDNLEEVLNNMLDDVINVKEIAGDELKSKKTIVFLPFMASAWYTMEEEWKEAMADENNEVYVVPIPYSDRDIIARVGEMHYEGDKFPDYVPVMDYEKFNIEAIHPDVIYINNPYDEYNYSMVVPNIYFASSLKNMTDKLVYIPWFFTDEIGLYDERAIKNMKYYVTVPGIVNSDEIILWSDAIKQSYVEVLCQWAGEDTKEIWENKIVVKERSTVDKSKIVDKNQLEVPSSWKKVLLDSKGNWKKTILYVTESESILEHGDRALDKIESSLNILKEAGNSIALLWKPQKDIEQFIIAKKPECLDRYQSIVSNFKSQNWGIFDENPDSDLSIDLSDAYYGDTNEIVQKFRNQGKPVMIQNVNTIPDH